ncbi:MAG TPA: carboxypeptidase-like regulatory domain-containing protein [Burkholderiales bacterium]|nr:carboxypeptidase-like regulatory domain-containing protein [Burkholderiales bacterium]
MFRSAALLASLAFPPAALAGGEMLGDLDDHHDEGPSYFGFVKDARGAPVADAKVTANVKNGVAFITRTTAAGLYKFAGFSKQIKPDDVTISCAKDGYKQARVLRRPIPKGEVKAVETECRLDRG